MPNDAPEQPQERDERPTLQSVDKRVSLLERDMGEVRRLLTALEPKISEMHALVREIPGMRADLGGIRTQVADLSVQMGEVRGKLSQVPSIVQLATMVLGILAITFAAMAFLKP